MSWRWQCSGATLGAWISYYTSQSGEGERSQSSWLTTFEPGAFGVTQHTGGCLITGLPPIQPAS